MTSQSYRGNHYKMTSQSYRGHSNYKTVNLYVERDHCNYKLVVPTITLQP